MKFCTDQSAANYSTECNATEVGWISDTLRYIKACASGESYIDENGKELCKDTQDGSAWTLGCAPGSTNCPITCLDGEVKKDGTCVRITTGTLKDYPMMVTFGQSFSCNSWFVGGMCLNSDKN